MLSSQHTLDLKTQIGQKQKHRKRYTIQMKIKRELEYLH